MVPFGPMIGDDRVGRLRFGPKSTHPPPSFHGLGVGVVGGDESSLLGMEPSSQLAHTRPSAVPMTTNGSALNAGEVATCTVLVPATEKESTVWHTPPLGHWIDRQNASEPVQVLVALLQASSGHVSGAGRQGFFDAVQSGGMLSLAHIPASGSPPGSQLFTKHGVCNGSLHRPRTRHT